MVLTRLFPLGRLRRLVWLGFAFFLAACGGDPPARINTGDVAPTFQTTRLDGMAAHFPAAWAGKSVVVRFWADWCKYCEGEMQAIEKVYRRHKAKGLEVIAINAGQDRNTVEAFVRRIGSTPPQAS